MSGYNGDFFADYEEYLNEERVREAHDFPIALARRIPAFDNVIDLGCGLQEFRRWANPTHYVGVDLHAPIADLNRDYRQHSLIDLAVVLANPPTAFVSLFSSEITGPMAANYGLYRRIFEEIPSVTHGLVSGFYYDYQKQDDIVEEIPGLFSYQTNEDISAGLQHSQGKFTEKRIIVPCPSKMFGAGVVEVWKFFERTK